MVIYCVIDLEGVIETVEGFGKCKKTTCWIKKGSITTWSPGMNGRTVYTFLIGDVPYFLNISKTFKKT